MPFRGFYLQSGLLVAIMKNSQPPYDEEARLEALRRHDILDTPVEEEFDDFAKLAAWICQTPIAVVNFVDKDRQWFKAEVGLGVRETPLDVSICRHAILQEDLFIVPDTTLDERFRNNPFVTGKPHLRFYAGALLKTDEGLPLGTLCVLDHSPREISESQTYALRVLARQVMNTMNLRRNARKIALKNRELEKAMGEIKTLKGLLPICSGCKKIRDEKEKWLPMETYVQQHTEASFSHGLCPACQQFYLEDLEKLKSRP